MRRKEESVEVVRCNPNLIKAREKVKRYEKDIYLKKLFDFVGFEVWKVNGNFVRKNICEDFVNFGQYYHFKFIPKEEFWLDVEEFPGEDKFYAEHLLIENRLMKEGIDYRRAFKIAKFLEKRERAKSSKVKKISRKLKSDDELYNKVKKQLLEEYSQKVKVWVVDGELVRDFFDINFGGGGHGIVDNFTPKDEVWLDDDISEKERKFILLHELHERRMMITKNLSYLEAHKLATKVEDFYRHYPSNVDIALKNEVLNQP